MGEGPGKDLNPVLLFSVLELRESLSVLLVRYVLVFYFLFVTWSSVDSIS